MPAAVPVSAQRAPRRARYLIPPGTPHRREALAALTLLAALAGLLFAQVTLGLAVAFHAIGKITRWRPVWLAVPAAGGVVWVLAIGPAAALAGFLAAPRAVVALIGGAVTNPARITHLDAVSTGAVPWFPGQFPIALILAAGIAAVTWWLDWLHTDEWRLPAPRPGLVSACRRRLTTAFVKSGGVLTRSGACLGVVQDTGEPAAVSWREAERGVLVTGSVRSAVSASGFQLVHAAIRLRKPVIVVDLAADAELAASLSAVCAATGVPLQVFGPAGTGYYDPLHGGDPAHKAALVMTMIDWDQAPDPTRLGYQSCLTDVLAVAEAAPGDPAMLDDVIGLLRPGALADRMERVPAYHPRRISLAGRVATTAGRLAAETSLATFVAEQLTSLRASPLGRWLEPGPPAEPGFQISVGEVIRQRGAALFTLDRAAHGRFADTIANLVAQDIAETYAGLRQVALGGDGLAWFAHCETVDPKALAGLVSVGADAGLATVFSTTSAAAVGKLADHASVLVLHRLEDRALAGQLAWLTGARLVPADLQWAYSIPAKPGTDWADSGAVAVDALGGVHAGTVHTGPAGRAPPSGTAWSPVVTGEALCALAEDEFTLVPRADVHRVVPLAVSIPAGIPSRQVPPGPAPRGPSLGPAPRRPSSRPAPQGPSSGPAPQGPWSGPAPQGPWSGPAPRGPSSGSARSGSPPGPVPPGWGDGHVPGAGHDGR